MGILVYVIETYEPMSSSDRVIFSYEIQSVHLGSDCWMNQLSCKVSWILIQIALCCCATFFSDTSGRYNLHGFDCQLDIEWTQSTSTVKGG